MKILIDGIVVEYGGLVGVFCLAMLPFWKMIEVMAKKKKKDWNSMYWMKIFLNGLVWYGWMDTLVFDVQVRYLRFDAWMDGFGNEKRKINAFMGLMAEWNTTDDQITKYHL